MTTQCFHCNSTETRVVETRRVRIREYDMQNKRHRCQSIVRTRECLQCRYRWRTVEMMVRNHGNPFRTDRGLLYVRRRKKLTPDES